MSTYIAPGSQPSPAPSAHAVEAGANVVVTFFTDYAAAVRREERHSLETLAELIRTAAADSKERLPWLKLARFGDIRSDKNSLRHNDNVQSLSGIEGDYDAEHISFDDAEEKLVEAGILAVLYTSPSHTRDAPRWRVLCPLSANIHPPNATASCPPQRTVRRHLLERKLDAQPELLLRRGQTEPIAPRRGAEGLRIDQAHQLDATAIGRPEKPKLNGQHGPATRPEDISEARIRGLVDKLLDNVRNAVDGEKHHTLFDIGRTLGGYLHLIGWSQHEAVEQLLAALPASVEDWDAARKTAAQAVALGATQPLELEGRPDPRQYRRDAATPEPQPEPQPDGAEPDEEVPPPGWDLDGPPPTDDDVLGDWVPPHTPPQIIVYAGERHLAVDAGLAALKAARMPFYQRGQDLVRISLIKLKLSNGDDVRVPAVSIVTLPMLMRALGRCANVVQIQRQEETRQDRPARHHRRADHRHDRRVAVPAATRRHRHPDHAPRRHAADQAGLRQRHRPRAVQPAADAGNPRPAYQAGCTGSAGKAQRPAGRVEFADDDNVSRSAAISMIMTPCSAA